MKRPYKLLLVVALCIPLAWMLQAIITGVREKTPADFKIKQALPAVTIAVHPELVRAKNPLPAIYGPTQLKRLYGGSSIEAMADAKGLMLLRQDQNEQWLHPFLQAAHHAFADHRPLVISPDMIWLLITQKIQRQLEYKPEIAGKLLSHNPAVQLTLIVERDKFRLGAADNNWPGVFAEFAGKIQGKSPDPAFSAAFGHRFSSSTIDSSAVIQITLMKAASPFYRYETHTKCGIPEIRLEGQASDWRWIHDQLPILAKVGLKEEVEPLQKILKEFIGAAEGQAKPEFWRHFFKWGEASGGHGISGWVNLFFNGGKDSEFMHNAERFPSGQISQEFDWIYFGKTLPMRLHAGFLGVSQDPVDLALRPEILWVIEHR